MNKWKMSFFVVLVLLIATNIFWLYSAIDAGVTYTYQQVSLDEKSKAVEMLGALVVKGGQQYTKKDVLHILRQMNKDAFIVEEENLIDVEGVKFIFVNGKLSEVKGLIRPTHMRPPVVNRRSEFYRPCCQYRSFIRKRLVSPTFPCAYPHARVSTTNRTG